MADIVNPGAAAGGPINSGAMPSNQNLEIYKGDFVEIFVTIKDFNTGVPVNLTGYTPAAVLKSGYEDYTPKPFVCTITNAAAGIVRIFMSSSYTKTLLPGSYIWDFQVTSPTSETRTYLAGDVTVYNEVTD